MRSSLALALCAAALPLTPPAAQAAQAPPPGRQVDVRPVSQPVYATGPLEAERLPDGSGGFLHLETSLPAAKDGRVPPPRVPVVLLATPYGGTENATASPQGFDKIVDHFTTRGYAVSVLDVPGTGGSSGCIDIGGPREAQAVATAVRHVARATWSSGSVGMYGVSYEGLTQTGVGTRGLDLPELKAIIPIAPATSTYDAQAFDGVAYTANANVTTTAYAAFSAYPNPPGIATDQADRQRCQPEHEEEALRLNVDGGYSRYWAERDGKQGVHRLRVPTLYAQGLSDIAVTPLQLRGFVDQVPEDTPFKLVLGQWGHAYPDVRGGGRADWLDMATAWFDQWLKGVDTGVLDWPAVQVGTGGDRWRGLDGWPSPRARHGQLALAPGGVLGSRSPEGEETYDETTGRLAWSTGPLPEPLHLTGNPVLDLHVVLEQPDAHLLVEVRAYDAAGAPLLPGWVPSAENRVITHGARSARHLAPIERESFRQQGAGTAAPVGVPLRVPVRLMPLDVVVPAGGRVEVELDGRSEYGLQTRPGALAAAVRVLYDCATPSVLRFDLPEPRLDALDVPVVGADGSRSRSRPWDVSGHLDGGTARQPVCGQPAVAPAQVLSASGAVGPVRRPSRLDP